MKQAGRKKKKVLYITRKYPPQVGGMENFARDLGKGLSEMKSLDVKILALKQKQIHLIWFFPYICLYVLLFGHKYDIIFIGDGVLCFAGILAGFSAPKSRRVINVFGLDITFAHPLYRMYLALFYRKSADLYISISRETDHTLHELFGNLPSVVITPGVNLPDREIVLKYTHEEFCRKYQIGRDTMTVITVGRLVKRKGVQWFLENVLPLLADLDIRYFIIGGGEDYDRIYQTIEERGLTGRVFLMGRIDDDELAVFYRYTDLFLMPNIHVANDMEGFGLVATEASAAGALVVASKLEGIQDAIIPGKNGILLKPEDAQDYVRTLHQIASDRSAYRQMAEDYASYTCTHYSWESICRRYVREFRRLLSRD